MEKYIGAMLDNRYEILEVIGTGGMAVVYKARCHRLNRFVAVKVLKEEFARDADFRRRFHAESQAVAMLSHTNIVAVYDVSRSADTEYIVMELIDGITMKQYMERKGVPLNWREALHFVSQTVKALSHAHGRGIIHRDIKPHNIMILRDGSVKVADFGIARLTSMHNTLTQDALGSVHYISPEQARGSHIDARSDIYSLGVVLYEMLTGRLPFEGDSAVSVAIQHINSMPLSPREINPEVPEALEVITMKAMASSLSRRYTSAEAMLADLDEFRKNPNVRFAYDLSDPRTPTEAPTKQIQTIPMNELARRKHQAAMGLSTATGRKNEQLVSRNGLAGQEPDMEAAEEEDYRRRSRNSVLTILVATVCVLVFLGGLVMVILMLTSPKSEVREVDVPDLLGQSFDEVYNKRYNSKSEYMDFEIIKQGEKSSSEYAKGEIMKQDPSAGDTVPEKTVIKVTVSTGPVMVEIRYSENREYRQVRGELSSRHFVVERMDEESEEPKDTVLRTVPPNGTMAEEGSTVYVYVSVGMNSVEIPPMRNKDYDAVVEELKELKLFTEKIEISSDIEKGKVVRTDPASGERAEKNSTVKVYVSTGPQIQTVRVPSYYGKMQGDLASAVARDGLTLGEITKQASEDEPEGKVLWQSLSEGATVEVGTTIHFRVSEGPPPTTTPPPPESPTPDDIVEKLIMLPMDSYNSQPTVSVLVMLGEATYYSNPAYPTDSYFTQTVTGRQNDFVIVSFDNVVVYSSYLRDIH
ncbi:MAG: Stk1 family PASTA domain-containing Ser/Thr kinase [Oscillospiraceae bacterium]|nr:Stk1 family PASTA domain-containing Ser/Thr kinase [Oscillospiraceae bacterium]